MFMRLVIILGLVAASGAGWAAEVCKIGTENDLTVMMQRVKEGVTTATTCPDPNPSLGTYAYFEISADIPLTKSISIPAFVHLKGNAAGKAAIITAEYEVKIDPNGAYCIIEISGDGAILENLQINANTYAYTGLNVTDTAICMKANNGRLNGITIAYSSSKPPSGFTPVGAKGVAMMGSANSIENSTITAKDIGAYISGNSCKMTATNINAYKFGALIGGKNPDVSGNTLVGKIGLGFLAPNDIPKIPIGQAANMFLFNNIFNNDPTGETLAESFLKVYGKTVESMPKCGECPISKTKILFSDSGSCQTTICDNYTALISLAKPMLQTATTTGNLEPAHLEAAPIDKQMNLITPPPPAAIDINKEIVDDKNLTKPNVQLPPDLQPESSPNAAPNAVMTGGGGCSLIKSSMTSEPGATTAPAVAPKTYDLQETALFKQSADHPGVLNQLTDVTFIRGINTAGKETFKLKGTYKANTYGQATELIALDVSTGTTIVMSPANMTSKCLPKISGSTAAFTCIYNTSANPTLPMSKLYLLVQLPNNLTLFNPQTVNAADFAVAETPVTPVTPAASACSDPTPFLMVDGTCGGGCGGNEEAKDKTCACKAGFSLDAATKACAPTPDLNPPAPAYGGHSCSLSPFATTSGELNTILALLLISMIAARACLSSKS